MRTWLRTDIVKRHGRVYLLAPVSNDLQMVHDVVHVQTHQYFEGPATSGGHKNPPRHIPDFERKCVSI